MKYILGALTAVSLLFGVAATQQAEARCFSNGAVVECFHHPYFHHHWDNWGWHHRWHHDW